MTSDRSLQNWRPRHPDNVFVSQVQEIARLGGSSDAGDEGWEGARDRGREEGGRCVEV